MPRRGHFERAKLACFDEALPASQLRCHQPDFVRPAPGALLNRVAALLASFLAVDHQANVICRTNYFFGAGLGAGVGAAGAAGAFAAGVAGAPLPAGAAGAAPPGWPLL